MRLPCHDIGFGLIVLLLLFVIFMIGIIALCGIPVLISGFTYSLLVVFLSFFAYNFFNMENNKGTVSGIIFTMCMNAVIGTMAGYVIKFKKQSNSLEA